jgi:transaldolase
MPEATLLAVKGDGQIPQDSVRGRYADAWQVLSELQALGVGSDDVTSVLEDNALAAFDASWQDPGDQLAAQLRKRSTREENQA